MTTLPTPAYPVVATNPDGTPRIDVDRAQLDETFRLEVRWDFTGTAEQAQIEAGRVADSLQGGEVTAIMDEDWEDV